MSQNVYLKNLREQYDALRKSIAGLQARAAEAKRDLTNEELRSVVEQGEKADSLFTQIKDLSEIELRNAQVDAMRARVDAATTGGVQPDGTEGTGTDGAEGTGTDGAANTRSTKLGGAVTQARESGIYVRGGQHSFMADSYRAAQLGDRDAAQRLTDHANAMRDNAKMRAVLGGGATTLGAGLVPPLWLAELYAPILHRRLRLAGQVRQVPWPGTPFPWSIPISGNPALSSQVAEGVNSTITDPSYTVLTVTPKGISGFAEVSRQMIDGSNPAVDSIIWEDLVGSFFDNCETDFITALNAQSGVNTVTVSAGSVTTTDMLAQRTGLLNAIAAISDNNAGDADIFVGKNSRWVTYLLMQDANGRPVVLSQQYSPQNAIGQGDLTQAYARAFQGSLENVSVVTSPTVAASTGFTVNSQELAFSYSPPQQFLFEQPVGPALIRLAIFGYEAIVTGRRPKAITKISYSGS
jgi:HK97 family phage major capsid protein